jgi:hypothetical protein
MLGSLSSIHHTTSNPRDKPAPNTGFSSEGYNSQWGAPNAQESASDRELEVCTRSYWHTRTKKYCRNRICRCRCDQCSIECADNDSYPMSRGGRGRGRGGRPNITGYEYDPNLKLDSKPSELFPVGPTVSTLAMVGQTNRYYLSNSV